MPVSRTVLERGNPPPTRQKACGACIKAKRRCDLRQPACLRCAHRAIPCVYPRKHLGGEAPRRSAPKGHERSSHSTQVAEAHPLPGATSECPLLSAMSTLSDNELFDAWVPDFFFPRGNSESLSSGSGGSCPSALAWTELPGSEPFPPPEPDASTAPETPDPFSGFNPCSNVLSRLAVDPGTLVTPAIRDSVLRTHLGYAIAELTAATRSMVLQSGTPWSHALLYRDVMPRCMQDAHAGCALYLAKNAANAAVVLRTLDARAGELAAAPLPAEPRALLAHVQASFLYLIVQLFDGDVSARASAEPRLQSFEAATLLMTSKLPPFSTSPATDKTVGLSERNPLGLLPVSDTRDFWTGWVFEESARRTCLVAFFFLQTYRLLSGAVMYTCCDYGALPVDRLSWTVSAHLWKADSVGDFVRAWESKRQFRVTHFQIDDVLAQGRPEDLDLCSKMLLTSMMGIDEVELWLAAYGGKLR